MASASDILEVRRSTNELTTSNGYTDEVLGGYIDSQGVAGANAKVWEEKAAKFSELVNVSEAGASHSFSDLRKNALELAAYWGGVYADEVAAATTGRVKVRKIVRS